MHHSLGVPKKNYRTTAGDAADLDLVMPMYNLLEYSSYYSDTTGSLWFFFSKDEAANHDANIVHDNAFKSFKYKVKLWTNAEADGSNGILKNTTITVPLKHLSNFWKSI